MGKKFWIVIAVVLVLVSGLTFGGVALLAAILPGVWVIAETLQQSEGLGETAFDVSWWLSTLGLVTILAVCVARAVHKKKGATVGAATWPLWIYGAAHLIVALIFGLLGMGPIANLPALLMSYVAQTVEMYISWVFPLLLLGIFVRSLWRWAKASWIEDGRSAQIAGAVVGGALLCSIAGGVESLADRGYTLAFTPQPAGPTEWFSPTADRKFHTWAANSVVPPGKSEPPSSPIALVDGVFVQRTRMTFGQCADQLIGAGERRACSARAERKAPGDGEDIAQEALINVCDRVDRVGLKDLTKLGNYYTAACTNGIHDARKKRRRINPNIDPVDRLRSGAPPPPQGVLSAIDCVERVSGTMSRAEQRLLELTKLGHEPREIAALTGALANTVSQRLSRLRKKLRENCFSSYRPTYRPSTRRRWP